MNESTLLFTYNYMLNKLSHLTASQHKNFNDLQHILWDCIQDGTILRNTVAEYTQYCSIDSVDNAYFEAMTGDTVAELKHNMEHS